MAGLQNGQLDYERQQVYVCSRQKRAPTRKSAIEHSGSKCNTKRSRRCRDYGNSFRLHDNETTTAARG